MDLYINKGCSVLYPEQHRRWELNYHNKSIVKFMVSITLPIYVTRSLNLFNSPTLIGLKAGGVGNLQTKGSIMKTGSRNCWYFLPNKLTCNGV
ncbi:hypothetical protein GDO86_018482 [Hymenochirus boettgeri]|uniref:Uncharacterized protein n=1 Tax=Hymenochirus boettgeri TaxID=247094 RepID=A0A8T2IE18_9PIPI|nr:hypothetical protein GDO86_018482 [Hymenochirus boettgeri]